MPSPRPPSLSNEKPALTAFRKSRIYAEGWNAARKLSEGGAKVRNPYKDGPERARWAEGFAEAG